MKLLCTFLLALTTSFAIAQPTLTQHLKYDLGDEYTLVGCDTLGMSAGMHTGPNTTWNLSLNTKGDITYSFVDKNVTSSSAQFPDANLVRQTGVNYKFYQKTATELRYFGNEILTQIGAIRTSHIREVVWPFTYNDSYADTVSIDFPAWNKNGTEYFSHTADGYGTLIVNGKTYTNVLRTFAKSQSVDTSNNNIETIEQTRWWDTAHNTALLEINYAQNINGQFYKVYLLKKDPLGGIKGLTKKIANINAHTQNRQLILTGDIETGKEYHLHLYNSTGQQITSQTFTATRQQFNTTIPDMPSGIYYIHLQGRGDTPGYIKLLHQ